ncbi:spliceosome-associated protein CWC27 homolog isoform X2 [Sphaerodactylus townsendi]|uniref:spliceosome-associated protein CWC27 homolog isoform X2 n=1 Tax=Sphaerodactylus townsendi TaxID=933632 RepID=UPI00202739B5|nr:spliceosome-associated protein CWC27 homolog isoform X2 [Sphaerodactylus townsendi]
MSNIYIQEPPTNGKVLLKTTAGDIDIELWSKEAPKACRNFVQLCMEDYYDNTIFHRVVPEFIVQGGDPTGTGSGGESIYGAPFKDEFHSRLRFNRRGLVAMANAGPHDNGSQFFFTLGRADELNNKHTIFGKITGDTIYNMLRLTEVEIGSDERPVNPHKIKSTEVLFNPFDDIIPRTSKKLKKEKPVEEVKKAKSKGTNDKANAVPNSDEDEEEDESYDDEDDMDGDEKHQMKERIAQKLKKDTNLTVKKPAKEEEPEKKSSRSEELRKEARQLKRELLAAKQKREENASNPKEDKIEDTEIGDPPNSIVAEYLEEKKKYEELRKQQPKRGASREDQTLALLNNFKSKLNQAIAETPENEVSEPEVEDDEGWMSHILHFEDKSRKVKDASVPDEDTFEIYDPRNPVTKRRREESKKILREKKARR